MSYASLSYAVSVTLPHLFLHLSNLYEILQITDVITLSVREPNSMPELSQLLFVQRLTKRTR